MLYLCISLIYRGFRQKSVYLYEVSYFLVKIKVAIYQKACYTSISNRQKYIFKPRFCMFISYFLDACCKADK